jgi:hypothetical protein
MATGNYFLNPISLEVLLTVGADEEISLTETERIRLLADYIQETERFDL